MDLFKKLYLIGSCKDVKSNYTKNVNMNIQWSWWAWNNPRYVEIV